MSHPVNNFDYYTFGWKHPGGAESSLARMIRLIEENPSMSKEQKAELVDQATYLAAHIASDIDGQIRQDYGSAMYSGSKYLERKDHYRQPPRWWTWLFDGRRGSIVSDLLMQRDLQHMDSVCNVVKRMRATTTMVCAGGDKNA